MSSTETPQMKVLVYSDDADVRAQVRLAIGRRPAADLPKVELVEVATDPALIRRMEKGDIEVAIFDGEAQPAGGIGMCRQVKDEIYDAPPIMVIIGRRDDGWLATWSKADAVVSHPIDPVVLAESLAELMRRRLERLPTVR